MTIGPGPALPALVIVAGVDPHRLRLASPSEPALTIELDRAAVRNEHMLVKAFVALHQAPHQFRSDTAPLIFGENKQVRIVDNEVAIRNGVAESDERDVIPGGYQ